MNFILEFLTPIKILVFFSFIFGALFLDKKKQMNKIVSAILLICLITEIVNTFFLNYKIPLGLFNSISIIFHNSMWLLLLFLIFGINKYKNYLIVFFSICLFNLLFVQGFLKFNSYTFILGSILFLIFFIYNSFLILKKENLKFFMTNKYLLLCAPVLFFIGLSFMFGFKSKALTSTIIFGNTKLYTFISYFVNIIYYTLINIYIYKERKLQHVS